MCLKGEQDAGKIVRCLNIRKYFTIGKMAHALNCAVSSVGYC